MMRFEHVDFRAGSSLQGHFKATYDELVRAFGEPTYRAEQDGGFDKVWTEWRLEFANGRKEPVYATIYDWKEDSPFTSRTGLYTWHIGGFDYRAEQAVGDVFAAAMEDSAYA